MSLIIPLMVMFSDDSDILVESEDRAGQQERLRHVIEQPRRHVVDLDHLISHQRDAAHDEHHRTGILRDLEALVLIHGPVSSVFHGCNRSYIMVSPAAPKRAAIT